jgi:hypothetical protein
VVFQDKQGRWWYRVFGVYGGAHPTRERAEAAQEMCLSTAYQTKPEKEKERERHGA